VAALLLALGVVAGIVKLAFDQQEDPTIRRALEKRRLLSIARTRDEAVTLPEAEDALVLSRRHDLPPLTKRFTKLVVSIKKAHRTRRRRP
jgi:hypothetical protein